MPVLKRERENVDPRDAHNPAGRGLVHDETGLRGSFERPYGIIENVVEGCPQPLERFRRSIDRQRLPATDRENAEVVDPVDMVGVLVSIDHGIDSGEPAGNQPKAKLRWSFDQYG